MLEASPLSFFSKDFSLEAEGREVAWLDVSWWREAAEVAIEGQPYRLHREGRMSGAFVLEQEGRILARAEKRSAFRSCFEVELAAGRFVLRRDSAFRKSFSLFPEAQEGVALGGVRPAGWFTRRAFVELPPDWPVPIQVFIFWLVLVIWKRDEAAAASS